MASRNLPTRQKKVAPKPRDLEEIIATLQSLGYKITPTTSEVDKEKKEESLERLGVVEGKKKQKVEKPDSRRLTATLSCRHSLGGVEYGPGSISLPASQEAIFRTLIHQEQLAKGQFYDTAEHRPAVNHFVIQMDGRKIIKKQVSEATLMSLADIEGASVTIGRQDIAGYAPTEGSF